jgi:CIC family chloride channel protein
VSAPTPRTALQETWKTLKRDAPSQVQFWLLALFVGVGGGLVAVAFRWGIAQLSRLVYGTDQTHLHSAAAALPWYWLMAAPICGGLIVGLILHHFTPDGRVRSVADVIEGAALNEGKVERRAGLASALASLITLSTGGSTGREGPVVHLAAVVSSWVSERLRADAMIARDLLGCAVAAAVSASFNAPIAGALFALEVILRHFAVHAFTPIVIASVAGTVVNRLIFGDATTFSLALSPLLEFYIELPAFMLLGLLCGLVSVVLMRAIFFADLWASQIQAAIRLPGWARPAVAGAGLGVLAIWFPQIIGVGYETTFAALSGNVALDLAMLLVGIKVLAVAITMGGRMGGGVFSPSLMIGALLGLAFGIVATGLVPKFSGGEQLYALAGMGALAAAVLGAPISTTMIVFELTGDWQTGLAVMLTVSISTAVASRLVDKSFFLTQLEHKDVHLAAGPQAYLAATVPITGVMRAMTHTRAANTQECWRLINQGQALTPKANLEEAFNLLEKVEEDFIPVVTFEGDQAAPNLVGAVFYVDALRAYNVVLSATAAEEHS